MKKSRGRKPTKHGTLGQNPVLTPLAAAIFAAVYPMGSALAQQADDPEEDAAIEQIVVTGSRIKHDTFSSAAPMQVVETEAAAVRGISDLATLLQTTTVAAGSPQVTPAISAVNVVNGGLGTSTLSLRGLGANRTLVLLNGRRAGPSGVQGSVSAFDLNTIPLSAIERVEILKDGASSIYGSDAIAGVVNIITRQDDGGELNAFYSQPGQSGGEQLRVNGSWGKTIDRGYFRITGDYSHQEILQRGDRDVFACNEYYIFDQQTGERADLIDPRTNEYLCDDLPWGHVWVYDYAPDVGDGTTNVGPPVYLLQYDRDGALVGNGLSPLATSNNPNWMVAPAGWIPVGLGDPLSDSLVDSEPAIQDLTTLVPEADVATIFLEGHYDLTDNTEAYGEVLLSRRETTNVGWRQVWTYIYNYDSADIGFPSDPFSAGWTGAQWISPLTLTDHSGQRVTVDYQRFVAGLRGEMQSVLPDWNWELSFQYSNSDGEYEDDQILTDALEMPYWRTGSCAGEFSPVSNRPCVDIQWLDPDFLAGDIPQEVKDFWFDTDIGKTEYKQWSVEGFISGDVMDLPAGPVGLALGLHYQDDEILDTPGPVTLAGNAWGASSAGITAGEDTTKAIFAEVQVPLISDVKLVQQLDFSGSVRYTDVDSYGSDTTYKVGLNWGITDEFRVRSTFGTSFRTPALYELYLARQTSFPLSARRSDICINWGDSLADGTITQATADNCAADGLPPDFLFTVAPTVVTGGGQGVLKAETSDAFTAGIVWQPSFAELSVSIDYFDIEVLDEVDVIGALNIVTGCYTSQFFPDEPLCDLFDRSPGGIGVIPGSITEIRDSYINVSRQHNRGLDIQLQYTTDLSFGTLIIDSQQTLQYEDTVGLFDNTEEDHAGEAGHPDWVGNLNFTLMNGPWSFFWGITYIGETDNTASFGTSTAGWYNDTEVNLDLKAESRVYNSLSVSREFERGYMARFGVANALDEEPPRLSSYTTGAELSVLGQAAFYSQYDWYGRRYFLELSKSF
ncbi:MAG TPA: TonB-dependent receptor [Woeseiaceae bacterium]|nr:TonB-dependent receptor [Woeseiaceae bacterium]